MSMDHDSFEYPIGSRITYYRTKKHITTNKLANLAGISQSYLREVELGNKNPTVEVVYQICKALGISLSELFNDNHLSELDSDPVVSQIYRLSEEQRQALLLFLNTIQ